MLCNFEIRIEDYMFLLCKQCLFSHCFHIVKFTPICLYRNAFKSTAKSRLVIWTGEEYEGRSAFMEQSLINGNALD